MASFNIAAVNEQCATHRLNDYGEKAALLNSFGDFNFDSTIIQFPLLENLED